jgi:hypothetical protein
MKTPTEQEMLKEAKQIEVAKRFIEDKNYTKLEKDTFIEFVRECERMEATQLAQKETKKQVLEIIDSRITNHCYCNSCKLLRELREAVEKL